MMSPIAGKPAVDWFGILYFVFGRTLVHFLGLSLIPVSFGFFLATALLAQTTIRVSVNSLGMQADESSELPSISADGRFVAFESLASNLAEGDTNEVTDIFVHDRLTRQTTRVSVGSMGTQGDDGSFDSSISADGRFVAFESNASNLVEGDTNEVLDVFVHDRLTGQTNRMSVDSVGTQGNGDSSATSISGDGRYVAFDSEASNLVGGDTNGVIDVFVHDRLTGQTARLSVDSMETQGNNASFAPSISADGRFVAFESNASNLVEGDTNEVLDVFVHDRLTGQTARVSVDSSGTQGNRGSYTALISGDGRYVAFESWASNLVEGDTNETFDVFVNDRMTRQTTRVSVDSTGTQGNDGSFAGPISADGRFVAFESLASNLVGGDGNQSYQLFVHDRLMGQTSGISDGGEPSISADGRYVAFASYGSNLVAGDTNEAEDVFAYDRLASSNQEEKLHFAQFGNGAGFTSDIVLTNPSSAAQTTGRVEILDDKGLPLAVGIVAEQRAPSGLQGSRLVVAASLDFSIPPLTSVTISTDGEGDIVAGSAVVTSDATLGGVIRFTVPGIGIAGVGASQPLGGFVTPVRRKLEGINTGIAIQNTENEPVTVVLMLRDGAEEIATTRIENLAAGGHLARFIDELFPEADTDDFQGTLVVVATIGKIAATALELGPESGQFTTLPVTPLN